MRKEDFYDVFEYGDRLEPGVELKIEHSITMEYDTPDLTPFTNSDVKELESLRKISAGTEQKIFDSLKEPLSKWERQAALTKLLDRAIQYLKMPEVEHTSNQWMHDDRSDRDKISNRVYQMSVSVYEDYKYDRQTRERIPTAWYVTWDVTINTPRRGYACAVNQALMAEIEKEHIVLPLYLYDHSALAMSTDSFIGRAVHAEWDSGQVGWIYVSKEDIRAEYQVDRITPSVREQAENRLKDEVRIYDAYLRGECYGYELYKNGELTDSCWGFVGSFDEAIKDIAEYLPDECKGMTEKLAEVSDPASMVKTLLKHARIQVEQAAKDMERKPREQVLGVEL